MLLNLLKALIKGELRKTSAFSMYRAIRKIVDETVSFEHPKHTENIDKKIFTILL